MSTQERGLRVMLATSYPLSEGTPGGVKDFTIGLANALRSKGCEVRTVGPRPRKGEKNLASYNVGRAFSVRHHGTIHDITLTTPLDTRKMRKVVELVKPDVINVQEPTNPFIPHTAPSASPKRKDGERIPCFVGTFHAQVENPGLTATILKDAAKIIRRLRFKYYMPVGLTSGLYNTIIKSLDGRIAVSKATAESVGKICGDHAEYEVIHNGIDIEMFTPDGPRIPNFEDGKLTIFATGRHDPRKDFETTIRAFALVKNKRPDVKLIIGGFGEETDKLLALVHQLSLPDVQFTGYLPYEKLPDAYRSADVFISSAKGNEGFGRILVEALACGTLVVGTDINGYREAIGGHDFARLAKPENPEDQALKILEFLELSLEKRRELAEKGRSYVEKNFAWQIIAEKTIGYYEKCLDKHGRSKEKDWPERKRRREKTVFAAGTV